MTRDAIDGGDTELLYQLEEYFHCARQEAILLSRVRDGRRTSAVSITREVECRKIQERAIDGILEDL